MAKTKDTLSKVWLRRASEGILSRRLCGGRIAEQLPTEQPQISNRQVDMLVRNDQGQIHHVEFQATQEPGFAFRMLDYWVYFRREYGQPVHQRVFYIGAKTCTCPPSSPKAVPPTSLRSSTSRTTPPATSSPVTTGATTSGPSVPKATGPSSSKRYSAS